MILKSLYSKLKRLNVKILLEFSNNLSNCLLDALYVINLLKQSYTTAVRKCSGYDF